MKYYFSIAEHTGGGKQPRYHLDGARTSRAHNEYLKQRAYMHGRVSCAVTKVRGERVSQYCVVEFD